MASRTLCFLCTTEALGGLELNLLRLGTWMCERGWDVHVAGVSDGPLLVRATEERLPTIPLQRPYRYGDFRNARCLANILDPYSPTITTVASRDVHLAVLAHRRTRNSRLIHLQQMQLAKSKKDPFHRWEYRHYDAWVAPLPWLAAQAREFIPMHFERIHTIPLGIDLKAFTNGLVSARDARMKLHLPVDRFIAGVVGRLDRGKGQEYLIQAAAILRNRDIQLDVVFIGDETIGEHQGYGTHLRHLAQELGIDQHVHLIPAQRDVTVAYSALDLFVLTSISETYGMVTIEAMAAGLPVIGTNTAGTPEIIRHGETGILVPPRDPDRLADAIQELILKPQRASMLARSGCDDAHARFSHHAQVDALERLLLQMRDSARSSVDSTGFH